VDKSYTVDVSVPQYKTVIVKEWPNGTIETKDEYTGEKIVQQTVPVEECTVKVNIADKEVTPILQGYACSDKTGEIICDSCSDGNCDGTCSPNGGETCCRIVSGVVTCKNSVVSWTEKSALLPVEALK
jgi:hypothetical protein